METVMKADIFFFVSTIGVVLVTAVFLVAGYYLVKAARAAASLFGRIEKDVDAFEYGVHRMKREVIGHARFALGVGEAVASALLRPRGRESPRRSFEYPDY